MKAFQQFPPGGGGVNSQKKPTNKKELEDMKKKEDEHAAARAFEEYMEVFQETNSATNKAPNKVWVKAGTYEAGKKYEDRDSGKLYKPKSRFEKEPDPVAAAPGIDDSRPERLGKKAPKEKKKSNLEIFKDELKLIQEEREERHRLKNVLGLQEVIKLPPKPGDDLRASISLELDDVRMGSIDDGDPNTTNIYLGNLPTKISEQQLMDIFGQYGPLASVKVMWPRTDEEKARNRLSGFVAYMSRRDGERALKNLAGKDLLGSSDIKLGWGKAVPIPVYPIYVPPVLLEMTMPPPLSGLPFNAQPEKRDRQRIPPPGTPYPSDPKGIEEFERVLKNSTVKVVTPSDRGLIALIHRMVEFVAREGPMFEAMIMNREMGNPVYRFLFENQSPAHIYYRWKLFSILQGESVQRWRTEDFRMFKGGSIWRPPTVNPFTQGMPEELIPEEERESTSRKGTLSNAQRNRIERMLRWITPERHRIAEIMIFSIEHTEAVDEICQIIRESLTNPKTTLVKKVARLYVISDILHNCCHTRGSSAVAYRKCFQQHLPSIFQETHFAHQTAVSEGVGSTAESFKQRVLACFRAWEEWAIYPNEFLIRLQNIFLGLTTINSREDEAKVLEGVQSDEEDDIKRKRGRRSPPRAQMPPKSALNLVRAMQATEPITGLTSAELDGAPIEEDEDNIGDLDGIEETNTSALAAPQFTANAAASEDKPKKGGFLPSKWETVDPEEVKAQAVTTTSKWDLFEESNLSNPSDEKPKENTAAGFGLVAADYDEDLDGEPMEEETSSSCGKVGVEIYEDELTEERRIMLREIENKVLAYQDDLESGRRKLKSGETLQEACQVYREKLVKKADRVREREIRQLQDDDVHSTTEEAYRSGGSSRRDRTESRSDHSSKHESSRSDRRHEGSRNPDYESSSKSSKSSRKRNGASPSPVRDDPYESRSDRERDRTSSHRQYDSASRTSTSEKSSSRKHGGQGYYSSSSRHDSPTDSPKRSRYRSRSPQRSPSSARRSSKYVTSPTSRRSSSRSPTSRSSRHRNKHRN